MMRKEQKLKGFFCVWRERSGGELEVHLISVFGLGIF
jgi:hypothetical protein